MSAHPPEEVRFCGCGKVCVDSEESYRILYAVETDDGWTCELRPSIDETEEHEPGCFTAGDDEKIIAVLDGERNLLQNPNSCAQTAIDRLGDLNDCTGCTDDDPDDDDCISRIYEPDHYTEVSRHAYTVDVFSGGGDKTITIRTRMCKPPAQWEDREPEAPPGANQPEAPPGANQPEAPPGANQPQAPPGANQPEAPPGANQPGGAPEEDDESGGPGQKMMGFVEQLLGLLN